MPDSIRSVRQTAPTSGTQNYEVAGFGTPDAALIFSHNSSENADLAEISYCVGVWDGSNQKCIAQAGDDAGSGTAWSRLLTDKVVELNDETSRALRTATVSGTATNGITLSWNTESGNQPIVTVVLFKCGGGSTDVAVAGNNTFPTSGTKNITTTNCNPNFIFFAGHQSATVDADATTNVSRGFAADESGGITQGVYNFRISYFSGATLVATALSTSYVDAHHNDSTISDASSVSAFGTGQFTVSKDVGTLGNAFLYLAMDFADVPHIFSSTTPTTDVAWDPVSAGDSQQRQAYVMLTGDNTTGGVDNSASGNSGYYVVTTDEEYGASFWSEDAVVAFNSGGRHSSVPPTNNDALMIQPHTGGAPAFSAADPTFNATGLNFPAANNDHGGSAYYVLGVGFGKSGGLPSYRGGNRGILRGVGRGVG